MISYLVDGLLLFIDGFIAILCLLSMFGFVNIVLLLLLLLLNLLLIAGFKIICYLI